MAKLPRLMRALPHYIEPDRLADHQQALAGDLEIDTMPRLADLLVSNTGTVQVELRFARVEHGHISITGTFSTVLIILCQRCLQPFELALSNQIGIGMIADKCCEQELPSLLEPYVLDQKRIRLVTMVEDEILLSLPIAPCHEPGECVARGPSAPATAVEYENPFAVLKEMRKKSE